MIIFSEITQKFVKTNESNKSGKAIHTIEAPNLKIKYNEHINKNLESSENESLKHFDRQVTNYNKGNILYHF